MDVCDIELMLIYWSLVEHTTCIIHKEQKQPYKVFRCSYILAHTTFSCTQFHCEWKPQSGRPAVLTVQGWGLTTILALFLWWILIVIVKTMCVYSVLRLQAKWWLLAYSGFGSQRQPADSDNWWRGGVSAKDYQSFHNSDRRPLLFWRWGDDFKLLWTHS